MYDDVLNITWIRDATGLGLGTLRQNEALAWVDNFVYGGREAADGTSVNDWRLPDGLDPWNEIEGYDSCHISGELYSLFHRNQWMIGPDNVGMVRTGDGQWLTVPVIYPDMRSTYMTSNYMTVTVGTWPPSVPPIHQN